MLSDRQRETLENMGPASARLVLSQSGGGLNSPISGFSCGEIVRGDVMQWLEEKHSQEQAQQNKTLRWAQIAGWAGIVSVLVGLLGIILQR